MNVEELKFAAVVRSLAGEMFDEEQAFAARKIERDFDKESWAAEKDRWSRENSFDGFIIKALHELDGVAQIIKRQVTPDA